ncbi:MAG TPA: sorbosone dehydrogenase family protein [Drouetiella sp.]
MKFMLPRPLAKVVSSALILATAAISAASAQEAKIPVEKIKVPKGFKVNVFSTAVPNARSMCLSPNGTLFVGTRQKSGSVYALVDKDKDGQADDVYVIAKNLLEPNGVAFKDGALYIAEINRVTRLDNIEKHLKDPPAPVVVSDKFPNFTHHGWKFIRFGPDGELYVPVGAPCNVCMRPDPFAGISRMKADGTGLEQYARGIRNTVGFDWHPVTKKMWFTDNGRDLLGDLIPPDELNSAPEPGMHFGFPYFYGNNVPDPEFGSKAPKDLKPVEPKYALGAHVAALGMRFYTGNMFPEEYKNQIFFAEHGSWNSSKKVGYQVLVAKLDGDKVKSVTPFATGFLQPEEQVLDRPVDVQVMPDGALLVSSDEPKGTIYRISYGDSSATKSGAGKSDSKKSGNTKPGDTKSGDTKSGTGKSSDTKSSSAKSSDTKNGDAKSGDAKSGTGKSSDTKPGSAKEPNKKS